MLIFFYFCASWFPRDLCLHVEIYGTIKCYIFAIRKSVKNLILFVLQNAKSLSVNTLITMENYLSINFHSFWRNLFPLIKIWGRIGHTFWSCLTDVLFHLFVGRACKIIITTWTSYLSSKSILNFKLCHILLLFVTMVLKSANLVWY